MEVWITGLAGTLSLAISTALWLRWDRLHQKEIRTFLPVVLSTATCLLLSMSWTRGTTRLTLESRLIGLSGLLCAVASITLWVVLSRRKEKKKETLALPASLFSALAALFLVTLWLRVLEPAIDRAEALKSGGLASGAIIALYALWLNDRRRRVEESRRDTEEARRLIEHKRQELESDRAEHDRERVASEHFTRAVELLGDDADQVRVGAFHALANLAVANPAYGQTVADVLCSYLRRPAPEAHESVDHDNPEIASLPKEFQVRQTAERLIARLVSVSPTKEIGLNLDLTGADIQALRIENALIGEITAYGANFRAYVLLDNTTVQREADFGKCKFQGGLTIRKCSFKDSISAIDAESGWRVDISDSTFDDVMVLHGARIADELRLKDSRFASAVLLSIHSPATRFNIVNSSAAGRSPGLVVVPQWARVEMDDESGTFEVIPLQQDN
jgi:hypothetical protein